MPVKVFRKEDGGSENNWIPFNSNSETVSVSGKDTSSLKLSKPIALDAGALYAIAVTPTLKGETYCGESKLPF